MTIDPVKAQYCADIVTTNVVSRYAKEVGIPPIEALRKFMDSKTYMALQDPASRLCFESTESVLDTFNAEENCDWDEWLKV
jgi:hypothetical protein